MNNELEMTNEQVIEEMSKLGYEYNSSTQTFSKTRDGELIVKTLEEAREFFSEPE